MSVCAEQGNLSGLFSSRFWAFPDNKCFNTFDSAIVWNRFVGMFRVPLLFNDPCENLRNYQVKITVPSLQLGKRTLAFFTFLEPVCRFRVSKKISVRYIEVL